MQPRHVTGRARPQFEIDESYYQQYEELSIRLGLAEQDIVLTTEGLASLEKKLMIDADESYFKEHRKRLPEALQRRDARAHPEFLRMIRAKASAHRQRAILKAKINMLQMRFEEWRTRSADRRSNM